MSCIPTGLSLVFTVLLITIIASGKQITKQFQSPSEEARQALQELHGNFNNSNTDNPSPAMNTSEQIIVIKKRLSSLETTLEQQQNSIEKVNKDISNMTIQQSKSLELLSKENLKQDSKFEKRFYDLQMNIVHLEDSISGMENDRKFRSDTAQEIKPLNIFDERLKQCESKLRNIDARFDKINEDKVETRRHISRISNLVSKLFKRIPPRDLRIKLEASLEKIMKGVTSNKRMYESLAQLVAAEFVKISAKVARQQEKVRPRNPSNDQNEPKGEYGRIQDIIAQLSRTHSSLQ